MNSDTGIDSRAFEKMTFDELLNLREQLDLVLAERLAAEEQSLQERLERFKRVKQPFALPTHAAESAEHLTRRKLPIRYRNPDNPSEAWAGRGLQPRWLKKALQSGRDLSDFLVPGAE
jgi:DNA-binding protein H-NS